MVPENYEKQARPGAENDLQRPLAERILAALRPVLGPVRGLDLASRAQSPDLQMVLFPLMNHNTRYQRQPQQLHRSRNLLPLQLLSLVPLKDLTPSSPQILNYRTT